MLQDLNAQIRSDFEVICAGDFSEEATISDGVETITLRCLFDEAVTEFDPETQSMVLHPGSRMAVAETATTFNLRRAGLAVTVRAKQYTVRLSDWEFDGVGQLLIYLNPVPLT